VTRNLTEDPVLREQRHHHELREQARLHPLHHAPRQASGVRLAELHRPHQSEAAHFLDGFMYFHERLGQFEQPQAELLGPLDEVRLVQLAQRCEPSCHREVVRREGRAVADGVLEGVEDAVVDMIGHQQRAHGHVATRERLRNGDEIGLETPVLEGEQLARAGEARLHLVNSEESPVAAAELLSAFEITVRRQVHSLALDRLDEEECHVLAAQLTLESVKIAERNLREPRQQRSEAFDEVRIAVRRERAERQAVKRIVRRDHA
jgi:hypothetical protein